MKFLHTADWQIGLKAKAVGQAGSRVREERLAAARRVVTLANKEKVDFLLLAGDVFEDNGVDRYLVQQVGDVLARAAGPVYIIPGNHDPAVPGSVWDHPVWRSSRRLQVLMEKAAVNIPGGRLYPCPLKEKSSGLDPTAWIKAEKGDAVRIGLAHGTVESAPVEEQDHPISRRAASKLGLDYLALGHWHSTAFFPEDDGAVRLAYSGTPEPTGFAERDSGHVLLVEIAQTGARPEIKKVPTGRLKWETREIEIAGGESWPAIKKELASWSDPESSLLEIRLQGLLEASHREEPELIDQMLQSKFLFSRLDATHLTPSPEDEGWVAGLPVGIVRETAERLRRIAAGRETASDLTPQIAAQALLELYALAAETA
ncbi:MAG: DNA repair exonuclease [Thermodesulfobacteriota bacterium]